MLLILGAGYIGAAVAELALERGEEVVLADNWRTTGRAQLDGLEAAGARVETADIRDREALDALLAGGPRRVLLLAAQASRPISECEPDYTEQTNVTGARRVAEAVAASAASELVHGSSLQVYGSPLAGEVGPDAPYGEQGDLAHLSKIYAELALGMHARRGGFGLANCRLGIVYGPSPVQHDAPDSQTVVDKFRRLAAAGEPLTIDGGGRATIGAVHVADTRESPSLEVLRQLAQRGADVRYCDPHIPVQELDDEIYEAVPWSAEEVAAADLVVMLTAHREFLEERHWEGAHLVVDTRNVIPRAPHVFSI